MQRAGFACRNGGLRDRREERYRRWVGAPVTIIAEWKQGEPVDQDVVCQAAQDSQAHECLHAMHSIRLSHSHEMD